MDLGQEEREEGEEGRGRESVRGKRRAAKEEGEVFFCFSDLAGVILDQFLASYRSFGLKPLDLLEGLQFFVANPSRANLYVEEREEGGEGSYGRGRKLQRGGRREGSRIRIWVRVRVMKEGGGRRGHLIVSLGCTPS
jgi:hypothetical protein